MSGGILPGTVLHIAGQPVTVGGPTRWTLTNGVTIRAVVSYVGHADFHATHNGRLLGVHSTLAAAVTHHHHAKDPQ